jgi:signal transduction histidine kinase
MAEWLLLPLFLLPVAVGIGALGLAAELHRREMDPYVRDGERRAEARLREPARSGDLARSLEGVAARLLESDRGWIGFTHPGGPGQVRWPRGALGAEPWVVTGGYASGLLPEALADAGIRLRVETGTAPGTVEGADPAAVAFRRLYLARDLDDLRTAPLPATTKRFLVRRWRKAAPEDAALEEAGRFLDAVAAATARWPLPPGEHRIGDVSVLAGGGSALVFPDLEGLPTIHLETSSPGDSIGLVWTFPPPERGDGETIWSGRIEEPVAGTWRFVARGGKAWWQADRVRRWGGPIGAGLALFLVLPTALLVSIRRRRRHEELRVRFVNELAHDLRTPLTSLRLHADMLAGGKSREQDLDRYVDVITRESARLTALLGNLLDLSRLEGRRRTFEPEALALDEVAGHAIGEFVALYPKRADDVRVRGADDVHVAADRSALARCLGNLLDNAGKFTSPGTRVTLSWEVGDGRVRIVLRDEGRGIAEAERGRVFDRYARGGDVKANGIPGTGLGLSLVRELSRGMGSEVRLLPESGGAAFEIDLPRATP